MRIFAGRRVRRSDLVWVGGVVAGLIAGGVVAYGLAATSTVLAAH